MLDSVYVLVYLYFGCYTCTPSGLGVADALAEHRAEHAPGGRAHLRILVVQHEEEGAEPLNHMYSKASKTYRGSEDLCYIAADILAHSYEKREF